MMKKKSLLDLRCWAIEDLFGRKSANLEAYVCETKSRSLSIDAKERFVQWSFNSVDKLLRSHSSMYFNQKESLGMWLAAMTFLWCYETASNQNSLKKHFSPWDTGKAGKEAKMDQKRLITKYTLIILFIFSLSFLVTNLPTSVAHAGIEQLSMGTATIGGTFPNLGGPLAQCVNKALPDVNITSEYTQGTTENLRLIQKKKMQLGMITPMLGFFARKGIKMFKGEPIDFRVIVRLIPNASFWAVLQTSNVRTFADLKGHKVSVGPPSGGLGVVSRAQLAANHINYKKDIKPLFLGAADGAQALKDGNAEACLLIKGLAHLVASTHRIRYIPWGEKELKDFLAKHPYFGEYTYPPNTFKGIDYPIPAIDSGIQLICAPDMDQDLVYKLSKAIVENLDCIAEIYAPAKALTPEWVASKLANPFHPGAIKYFKEAGLWKE